MNQLETAVIEFLDSLSLVINDQKLAPTYGMGEFLIHFLMEICSHEICQKPTFDPLSNIIGLQVKILRKVDQN